MYDLLVQIDPLNWNRILPDLAKSWQVSADGLTYTFSLREGVQFHDGAPLTAEDVVASFNHIIFPPPGVISPRRGLFDAVREVVATSERTVEFHLKAEWLFPPGDCRRLQCDHAEKDPGGEQL
jgi:peptide/nickel transport system substrate-binding protein